ncbi:hypothetical protein GW17_00015508 [Ensete ventricosum]|nr:hypothetical protein GW17_00015508 [Ensete ventricosum]
MVAPRSFLHHGLRIGFAHRGAITSRGRPSDNDIDLFLDRSLQVGRGIPGGSMVVIGEWSPVTDIVSEVSLSNEVFDMIFKIMAFLYVMSILSMETVVSSFVTPFGVILATSDPPSNAKTVMELDIVIEELARLSFTCVRILVRVGQEEAEKLGTGRSVYSGMCPGWVTRECVSDQPYPTLTFANVLGKADVQAIRVPTPL